MQRAFRARPWKQTTPCTFENPNSQPSPQTHVLGAQVSPPAAPCPGMPTPHGQLGNDFPGHPQHVQKHHVARTDGSGPHNPQLTQPGTDTGLARLAPDRTGARRPEPGASLRWQALLLGVAGPARGVGGQETPRTCCELLWDCKLDWSRRSRGAPFLDSRLSSQ